MTKLTKDQIGRRIYELDSKWREQGRTEEQQYAVRNFLTGSGANEIKRLIADVIEAVTPERIVVTTGESGVCLLKEPHAGSHAGGVETYTSVQERTCTCIDDITRNKKELGL